MNILQEIAETRRRDVKCWPDAGPVAGKRHPALSFREAIQRPGLAIIAEIKRKAPSAGDLAPRANARRRALAYQRGGADAISVLTEPHYFRGSFEDLAQAARVTSLPLLCKDFVVHEKQLRLAAQTGASAALLIVAILDDGELRDFIALCRELGLDPLVEVFDQRELDRALASGADLIGINSRNLRDFSVALGRALELRARVPEGIPVVAESGVRTGEDLLRVGDAGFDAVLIGTTLMRSRHPAALLRSWRRVLDARQG